jgi:hypothetical protein
MSGHKKCFLGTINPLLKESGFATLSVKFLTLLEKTARLMAKKQLACRQQPDTLYL